MLAECGIQFFLTTHSYFVIKKLSLIAQEKNNIPISVISEESEQWSQTNIQDGLPDNSIINESIRLYKEQMRLVLDE
jgi:predicted ATPase